MRKFIVLWYIMVAILVCSIVYKWYQENQTLISQTKEISEISNIRKGIRRIYMSIAELSLSGEMIFEWSDADFMLYNSRRIAVDSMLCHLSSIYPTEHIDSVRCLLENKEMLICNIVQVLDEQQSISKKIASQVPVIARKSVQEQPKKPKRKGFLGLFGKKETSEPTVDTTMLYTLNCNMKCLVDGFPFSHIRKITRKQDYTVLFSIYDVTYLIFNILFVHFIVFLSPKKCFLATYSMRKYNNFSRTRKQFSDFISILCIYFFFLPTSCSLFSSAKVGRSAAANAFLRQ